MCKWNLSNGAEIDQVLVRRFSTTLESSWCTVYTYSFIHLTCTKYLLYARWHALYWTLQGPWVVLKGKQTNKKLNCSLFWILSESLQFSLIGWYSTSICYWLDLPYSIYESIYVVTSCRYFILKSPFDVTERRVYKQLADALSCL